MEMYAVLQIVWWLLLGVLLIGLAVMVGMDMGVGTILRYVGRTDLERRVALNIIGPHWEGNQVWFVLGGGAVFAAFPLIYATAFSGFYVVMLLLLWSMILRPLGFEYRGKLASVRWRGMWDWALLVSGLVPMVIFGAAFGNLFLGAPFHFSWNLTSTYTGSFLALLNPFAILCGLLSAALSVFMGAVTLMNGAEGVTYERSRRLAGLSALLAVVLFAVGGFWVHGMDGYVLAPSPGAALFPFLLPSSSVPAQSLTVWNSTSSELTLAWMLSCTIVFVPLIVWYTSWAFYVMRGKVKAAHVEASEHSY